MFDAINYSIYGIPIFTYGMIGITTIVLATLTIYESMDSKNESILSNLPSVIPTSEPTTTTESSSESSSTNNPISSLISPSPTINKGGKKTKKNFKNKNNTHKKNKTSRKM